MSVKNSHVRTSDSVAESIPKTTISGNTALVEPKQSAPAIANPGPDGELVEIADCLAAQLRQCQANSLGWLIKAGTHLLDTRRELEPGEWTQLFVSGRLPLGLRSAQTLARIANNAALSNAKNLAGLPTAISTLDELAGLDPAFIEQAIREGKIRPEMAAATAKAFVRQQSQKQQHS